ncbi:MAG: NnrS family protein [Hyphomicrobiaceae bacterium]|nr:NnrS family protein [Hyphomicrobiaceae bacterium]
MSGDRSKSPVPLILSEGFRFFFLAGPLFSIVAMGTWLGWLAVHATGGAFTSLPFVVPPHEWHAHEMIYGYGAAVMAGFFLTAVPNWTGAEPARAVYIAAIAGLWLAGRLALMFSSAIPSVLVMAVDVAFVPVLGIKILLNLIKRPKPQNLIFLGLLALMTIGNVLMHLGWLGAMSDGAGLGARLGLLTLAALIAILGGHVTPAFTRNALLRDGRADGLPLLRARVDKAGTVAAIALAVTVPLGLDERLLAALALAAGVANAIRLQGWRGLSVIDQPILWSLHLGFAMLVLGYLALAAHWFGAPIGGAAALHVIAIGSIGGMTLAVMSRAALGHTGRPLVVARPIAWSYGLVALAALVRSLGQLVMPDRYFTVMMIAGGFWIVALSIFAVIYAPILARPRVDQGQ